MSHRLVSGVLMGLTVSVLLGAWLVPTRAASAPPEDLQAAKAATARYHSVQRAIDDGYIAGGGCVASPAGAMGIHYENPALMKDDVFDVERPEVLLYVPRENGRLELVAVEYFIEADQAITHPKLFGRLFNGPMAPHHPGMERHYDLHVWLWKDNPAGTFAQFNPALSCG